MSLMRRGLMLNRFPSFSFTNINVNIYLRMYPYALHPPPPHTHHHTNRHTVFSFSRHFASGLLHTRFIARKHFLFATKATTKRLKSLEMETKGKFSRYTFLLKKKKKKNSKRGRYGKCSSSKKKKRETENSHP